LLDKPDIAGLFEKLDRGGVPGLVDGKRANFGLLACSNP
jgi:hypothetical protein